MPLGSSKKRVFLVFVFFLHTSCPSSRELLSALQAKCFFLYFLGVHVGVPPAVVKTQKIAKMHDFRKNWLDYQGFIHKIYDFLLMHLAKMGLTSVFLWVPQSDSNNLKYMGVFFG